MHIAFVASEGVPFSKTGGLADVVGALPRALAALGHQVSLYLPRYRQTKLADPATVVRSITIPFDDKYRFASVVTGGSQFGVRFYFIDCPEYFDRDALYGTPAGDTTWATRVCFHPKFCPCSRCPGICSPCRKWNSLAR
jgi:starch synthase